MVETDTAHNVNIGSVAFEPGARTNWHSHKGGPIEVHGATPINAMTHVAIGANTNVGGAVWLGPVTDEEYNKKSD